MGKQKEQHQQQQQQYRRQQTGTATSSLTAAWKRNRRMIMTVSSLIPALVPAPVNILLLWMVRPINYNDGKKSYHHYGNNGKTNDNDFIIVTLPTRGGGFRQEGNVGKSAKRLNNACVRY